MFGEESGATVGCRREGSVVDDRMVRRYDGHVGEAKETPADGAHGGSEKDTGRGLRFEGARLGTSPFDVSVGAKDATERSNLSSRSPSPAVSISSDSEAGICRVAV